MRFSDLIPLADGVFQLEEGHGEWPRAGCDAVVIQFAGAEIGLTAEKLENDGEVL